MKGDNSRSKRDIDKGFRYSESVKIFRCSGMSLVAIKSSFDSPVVYFKATKRFYNENNGMTCTFCLLE